MVPLPTVPTQSRSYVDTGNTDKYWAQGPRAADKHMSNRMMGAAARE